RGDPLSRHLMPHPNPIVPPARSTASALSSSQTGNVMTRAPYELRISPNGITATIHARGSAVLASPTINRGTAFTLEEREALGLTGLLPTGISTLEGQLRRVYAQYQEQAND